MITGAIVLMAAGSITEHVWLRGWGLLIGLFGVGLCIHASIRRWAYQPFQDGYKAGHTDGREIGVAEGFSLATGDRVES